MFRLKLVSLISKERRHLCSGASVIPKIAAVNYSRASSPEKTTEVTVYRKISYGSMSKLFSSIAGYFSGLKCVGVDQADNSYYTVSGERWVVFRDDAEIFIPVEWIHWLSWKRMEAPTPKETIEQQASRKLIVPSQEEMDVDCCANIPRYVNVMCLSKGGMYLRIDGSIVTNRLGENGEESCLFSVKKKLDQTGHVEISSEVDMDLYDLISLNKLIDRLALQTNPLISDKHEEEAWAKKGVRSPEPTEEEEEEEEEDDLDETYEFNFRTSIFAYISNIFHFQLSRANRFGDPNGCAPRKYNSQPS